MKGSKSKLRKLGIFLSILVLFAGLLGAVGWYKLFREVPTKYDSPEELFKYGSIGAEQDQGIPYWIWLMLPRIFPEKLPGPGGYTSFGIVWEEGKELPIGFSKKTVGFPRVAINCAFCHMGTFRTSAEDSKPKIVLGGVAPRLDPQSYQRFLFACASDPKFTPNIILKEIKYSYDLSWFDTFLYRNLIIPQTKKALLKEKAGFAWMDTRPDWGHGRIDPFNPVKFRPLKLPIDETIGNSDMMPLWNMKIRKGFPLHWDGLNDSMREVVLSSAIGDGASKKSIDLEALERIEEFIMELQPPKYPFAVNIKLASIGSEIYSKECASCHAIGGEKTGKVISVEEIGTDPNRLAMWTEEAAETYNNFAEGYEWKFNNFHKNKGYVSVPLNGIWSRAPYLHNGSVPTLTDLLEAPENRPKMFYRGYDVYDPVKVGFLSNVSDENGVKYFVYDTKVAGNGNHGHLWGTHLSEQDKQALIEYLKTL